MFLADRRYRAERISENCVKKLSEKGFERRSECGFGRYIGAETDRIVPLRCSGRPRLTHLRDFSDSFLKLSEKPHERANLLAIKRLIAT